MESVTDDPLYDVALTEIVSVIPRGIMKEDEAFPHVVHLMALAWLAGYYFHAKGQSP